MKKSLISFIFIFSSYFTWSQGLISSASRSSRTLSLEECINQAIENNLSIKQSQLSIESEHIRLAQSKALPLPTINGFTNLNGNAGRNIDPFTNNVVTQTIGTNSLGLQAQMNIYDGFANRNTISRSKLSVKAAEQDLSIQKNNIALQIAAAYLNVLSSEDQIEISKKQRENTLIQLDRTQKMVKSGAMPETNLLDIEAQLANDDLTIINAQNNLESSKISLKQAMNINEDVLINTSRSGLPDTKVSQYASGQEEVYQKAISFMPEIKAGEIRTQIADKNIEIAKAQSQPQISLSSSWGTAYSSVAKNLVENGVVNQEIPVSAVFQGQTVPFVLNLPQAKFGSENIPYFNQLGNNQNLNLGLSVRIPIFNGYNAKYQTQAAKVQKKITETQNESQKLQIRQNIEQAYINMQNAEKRFEAIDIQVKTLEKSFFAADRRFAAGSGTFVDYNLAKTNLERAQFSLVNAKYDYIFRVKILDFYQNKPLSN
jgi:outer membrane protein